MIKLNALLYPNTSSVIVHESFTLEPLKNNAVFEAKVESLKKEVGFNHMNTFSFTRQGFLSLMLELEGNIAVSLGESEAIVQGAKLYEKLGNKVHWIGLCQEGGLNYETCENLTADYIFVSSYVMDTFVQTDLKKIKELTSAKIIANCSANKYAKFADMIMFDSYKISGYGVCGLVLYSNEELKEQYLGEIDALGVNLIIDALKQQQFESNNKALFVECLQEEFKDDLHFFVDPESTLPYTLHFGLKHIKAREMIRTLSLHEIYVTNGEGCSLGLARPSKIIQHMGYEEIESRWALSLTFTKEFTSDEIKNIVKTMARKYRQIKALS